MQKKLRLGMIGGGQGAFIGGVHRIASRIDDRYELVAGCLSSTAEKALSSAKEVGIDLSRSYPDFKTMAEEESKRKDGIEVVSIVTPNHMHASPSIEFLKKDIHVICDKPMTATMNEALEICEVVKNSKANFFLTHNYSGYPVIREMKRLVYEGKIGKVRVVKGSYLQGWLANKEEENGLKQAEWRTDPKRSGGGGCIGDIGTHAFNLIRFITGLEIEELSADIHTFVKGRLLDDNAQIMLRFKGGAKGALWSSQVAVGNENNLKIRIYGENGGIEWRQEDPNYLYYTEFGHPTQRVTRGSGNVSKEAKDVTRIPPGHPEGYLEGFANIYNDVYKKLYAQINNQNYDDSNDCYPTINDGVEGMRFIEIALESSKNNGKWIRFNSK